MIRWSIKKPFGNKVTVGLHIDSNDQNFQIHINLNKVSNQFTEVLNTLSNSEPETVVYLDEENNSIFLDELFTYFRSIEEIDVDSSEVISTKQHLQDKTWVNQNKISWRNFLKEKLSTTILDSNLHFIELILTLRFLNSAKILSDPFVVGSISEKERKDIFLSCVANRLYLLRELIKHPKSDELYKEIFMKSFINEFQRLTNFLEENNLDRYLIPHELEKLVKSQYNNYHARQKTVNIDELIEWLTDELMQVKTDIKNNRSSSLKEQDELICDLFSSVVNHFYLPRYALTSVLKKWFSLSLVDKLNFFAPRLLASVLIGFVPIVLTDEINQWGQNYLDPVMLIPVSLIPILCFLYLFIEIKNVLGYSNLRSIKRVVQTFSLGIFYSYTIAIIGHLFFTSYFNQVSKVGFPVYGTDIYIVWELFIFQGSMAFLLGLVLQAVWEDKPITQPL